MTEVLSSLGEQERADAYALLAALLLGPEPQLLASLAALPRAQDVCDPLGQAWDQLLEAAKRKGPAARDEYDALFVAPGTPRFNPYQCYYRAGWLMDKPLAQLRQDLHGLGLARAEGATELEDHIGALFEAMRMLVAQGRPREVQYAFFRRHLADWCAPCLDEIAAAPDADFYRAVARFAQAFLELESLHDPESP